MRDTTKAESLGMDQEDARLMPRVSTTTSTAQVTKPRPWFDAMSVVARRKLNAPPEWEWDYARVIGEATVGHRCDTLLRGGIPNKRKDGRKRTGRSRWDGVAQQECVVTRVEIEDARTEYERDTDNCADSTYRACRRCSGSGRASWNLTFLRSFLAHLKTKGESSMTEKLLDPETEARIEAFGVVACEGFTGPINDARAALRDRVRELTEQARKEGRTEAFNDVVTKMRGSNV